MNTKKEKKEDYKKMTLKDVERLHLIIEKQEQLIELLKNEVSDLSCKLSIYRSFYFKYDKDR